MDKINLVEQEKQFLRQLLQHGAQAVPCVIQQRTLIDNGYITEKHLGGNSFEYRATPDCIAYYKNRMNELETHVAHQTKTFEFGCE